MGNIGGPAPVSKVYTASGRPVDVQYRVVDASRLITSHDGEMRQNLAYPPELQPRDRTRAASEAQVAAIAGNLQPDRLGFGNDAATGAPIVGPDLVVESGNGRVLALRRALDENGPAAAAYREWLSRQGYELTGIKNPVLVRARMTGLSHDERIAFTQEANQSTLLKMGVSEQAASDAGRLTGLLDLYKGGQLDLAQNQEFARAFLKTLPEGERGDLTTEKGGLSQAGVDRLQAAMLHRAFGDAHLTANLMEATDTNIKAIGGALADVSGAWARMRDMAAAGEIPANMDVTADLIAAVRVVDKAREAGIPVSDMAAQGALFGDGLTDNGRALLAAMFREPGYKRPIGRAALGERLSGYADEAMKGQPGANLFGEAPSTPGQILGALDRQGNLLDQARAAITPQAAPEVTKAAETEVSRLLDAGDMQVAVGVNEVEGEKTVVYRSARELVAEADANIKAASEVSDCAIGIAA